MEVEIDRLDLRDDPAVLSPPRLDPLWRCSTVVVVRGFLPDATLDVEVDALVVVGGFPAGFPVPGGATVPLPAALVAGQAVRIRQVSGGATSPWSASVAVRDHTIEFPAGPPRPQITPAPVYQCGRRTGVDNLLVGCDVWIDADGVEVGRVSGASAQQGVNIAPPYGLGQSVVARASLCADPSPPSIVQVTQPPPAPMPTPGFLPIHAGGRQATITDVVNGAVLTVSRNGIVQSSFPSWGYRHDVRLEPPFTAGETVSATQQLCPGDPPSGSGTTEVLPCSTLPAPGVEPIQAGATSVVLTSFVPDARVKVFVDGVKTGDGSGPVVVLVQPVQAGAVVHVWQLVGACAGRTVQQLIVQCVAPPVGGDPSALDLFPVGTTSYDGGTTTVMSGHTHVVAGTVYYPAVADGPETPFNDRLAARGPTPIAVLVHGRHGGATSHLGYTYLQRQLARMGIIAASVDCNESDQWGGWADNIRDRADLILASIAHLQALAGGGHPIFAGRIDFTALALMGHSRGGDAVVVVPEILALPGVTIRGVISLAPVNSGASSGRPSGYPFMTVLPASDGDVVDNNGAQFYDAADPSPFKSQLYVHSANHNFFNREWTNDDTNGGLALMSRADHERILSTYGCAFFRSVLLGHPTVDVLDGTVRPPATPTGNVHLSFEQRDAVTVDDHEDANGIALNSLASPTTQSGLTAAEYPFRQNAPGRFNDSFFGNTTGMVGVTDGTGSFRSELDRPTDLRGREVRIRAAEVYNGRSVPAGATGFALGLEDVNGAVAWVDSDGCGGLPRPFERRAYDLAQWYATDKTKTMLHTLRFPSGCFGSPTPAVPFDLTQIVAVRIRLDRQDGRALSFDDVQVVG